MPRDSVGTAALRRGPQWAIVFARASALASALLALAAIAGYFAGIDDLVRVRADFPAMALSTAMAILACAVALFLVTFEGRALRSGGALLGTIPAAIGGITIASRITGLGHLPVDTFVARILEPALEARTPAPISSIALTLLGLSLLGFELRMKRGWRYADLLALGAAMIGIAAFTGYLFGAAALYGDFAGDFPPTGVAFASSVCFIALSAGMIAARPASGVMEILLRESPGGRLARMFLAGTATVALVSALSLSLENLGLYDRATALALPPVITLFFAAALVLRQALRLDSVYEALSRSESDRRQLFDAASDAIFVAGLDARYLDANAAATALVGFTREELLGKTILDLIPSEDVPRLAAVKEKLLSGASDLGEWTLRRKDGTFVPVELAAQILPNGRWQAFVRDITARKQVEEALARERAWLRAVIDQMPVGVLLMDTSGKRLAENRALMTLASGGERRPDPFGNPTRYDLRLPGNREPVPLDAYPLIPVLRGEREEVRDAEFVVRQADGADIPILVDAAAIRADDGTLLGGVSTVRDISALKELDRLREEWASVVAHDLRQPVTTIRVAVDEISRMPPGAARDRMVAHARSSALRLERMIRDLLDVSRLDAHRFQIEPVRTDLVQCLPEFVERATTNGHDVRLEMPPATPPVLGDPQRLEQALGNLLSNAAKYGDPAAPIVVRLREAGDGVDLSVSNRGAGMTEEELSHLFERFHRTDSALRSGVEGLGLGLYITRGLIEAHGGTLRAESTPGGTTTFTIHLPRMPDGTPAHRPRIDPGAAHPVPVPGER